MQRIASQARQEDLNLRVQGPCIMIVTTSWPGETFILRIQAVCPYKSLKIMPSDIKCESESSSLQIILTDMQS